MPKTKRSPGSATAAPSGRLRCCKEKLRLLRPDLFTARAAVVKILHRVGIGFSQERFLDDQLANGENRAAIVVSLDPLLIAAYSQQIDCVAMLEFPAELARQYQLEIGTRLLSLNINGLDTQVQSDLIPGPRETRKWQMTNPLIADFISVDYAEINRRKRVIPDSEWHRTYYLGLSYLQERPGLARSGLPMFAAMEAEPQD